jgi:DNA-binding transcriptional ArsR family regulator
MRIVYARVLDVPVLEAIASPRRREILRLVWKEERSAGEIHRSMPDISFGAVSLQLKALGSMPDISFGAVSLQLKALEKAGLVDVRPEHKFRYYKAKRQALGPLARSLEFMWDDALWKLKLSAELEASRRGPRPSEWKAGKRK